MKPIIDVIDNTFLKSAKNDIIDYFNQFEQAKTFILASDYCISDKKMEHDVFSFVIIPNMQDFFAYKDIVSKLIPKDLKNTTMISPQAVSFLTSPFLFSVNIIMPKGKSRIIQGIDKEDLIQANENAIKMIETWIMNEPSKEIRYRELANKYKMFKQELNKKSFNVTLYTRSFLLATLSAYLTHQIFKYSNAMEVIWFSDRDNMTTANRSIIFEDYSIQYNGIYRNDNSYTRGEG